MAKRALFTYVLFICFSSCSIFDSTENPSNLVIFSAQKNAQRQIFSFQSSDPLNSIKEFTKNDHQNIAPVFSPDKLSLIYGDRKLGDVNNPALVLYSLSTGNSTELKVDSMGPLGWIHVSAAFKIWHPQELVLFLGIVNQGFTGHTDLYKYNLSTSSLTQLTFTPGSSERPIGFKDSNTLIAYSSDTTSTSGQLGFCEFDINYLSFTKIDNPYLKYITIDGIIRYGPYHISYNRDAGLFLMSLITENSNGFKITLSNYDGSYYEELTEGDSYDTFPVFGPDNQSIIFVRSDLTDPSGFNSEILSYSISDKNFQRMLNTDNQYQLTNYQYLDH